MLSWQYHDWFEAVLYYKVNWAQPEFDTQEDNISGMGQNFILSYFIFIFLFLVKVTLINIY